MDGVRRSEGKVGRTSLKLFVPEHEIGNLRKCIHAGYTSIILISDDTNHLIKMQKAVGLEKFDSGISIEFYTSEEAQDVVQKLSAKADQFTVIRGRTIKTHWSEIGEQEKERREIVLAKVLSS